MAYIWQRLCYCYCVLCRSFLVMCHHATYHLKSLVMLPRTRLLQWNSEYKQCVCVCMCARVRGGRVHSTHALTGNQWSFSRHLQQKMHGRTTQMSCPSCECVIAPLLTEATIHQYNTCGFKQTDCDPISTDYIRVYRVAQGVGGKLLYHTHIPW